MTAIMQRICGAGSEGNEFQHPTGVGWTVAVVEVRPVSVKYTFAFRTSATPPCFKVKLVGAIKSTLLPELAGEPVTVIVTLPRGAGCAIMQRGSLCRHAMYCEIV